ncbi:hypothetical protein DTO166G4_9183 [Paecilomyces variotii]|uniref:Arf-GAP domain-containing protein n=1 Tax=Byssochlamys spectabilis TaxID=264951 RepID=A0A443I6U6_BYSSP|nr:hypothetical protein C8Q69DRAFT_452596 [Paecilomyces variotii]KAJ9192634.1 hypothetical protein DTO032I3_8216 [Paecilomyces variotii]KAJ9200733.1 hypothetical protein DTO164E3_3883 [Paecilomyces variotii]KAJ9209211.1 hypothetical protein DTO166G4_9183 [Paecilomyces variotii]KAJ9219756.1 hypothetical protein DTO169C6_7923 [Paecilomyces variotii]KAJ9228223.1 hypothetical protein DTO166G5_8726 [Paecilomyces variotii]
MSRRPTADRAAQNQQTIKSLLKLEHNKVCADCKRNKHPRWASWNLGIFICIRCSGIHRGMGTHISRVKSVDLDSWTDEQLQSVLKWGNARANKYWEAKLAPGHVPSEAKIENFIRTKYESKRWVMDGPMPDPSTLDVEGDDDVPLAVVQEKAKLERSASQRLGSVSSQQPPVRKQTQSVDLFGDDDIVSPPTRPSTTDPPIRAPPPKASQPAPKQTKPGDSLLGLDFFGSSQPSTGSRPASLSSTPAPTGLSRPDLKQSILSLYASAPKPQPAAPQHERTSSFGNLASPQSQSSLGGLTDAFSGLSFPSTATPPPQKQAEKPSPFSNLGSFSIPKSSPAAPQVTSPAMSSGGGLFDTLASSTSPKPQPQRTTSVSSNGLDFSFTKTATPASRPNLPTASSTSNDLFGLSSPPTTSPPPPKAVSSPSADLSSIFNLSKPAPQPAPAPAAEPTPKPVVTATSSVFSSNLDPWGSDAWSTPDPAPAAAAPSNMMKVPDTLTANDIGSGWGAPSPSAAKSPPAVAADEDFGGWASAAPEPATTTTTTTTTTTSTSTINTKPAGGFGGADDLFGNVWG